MLRFKGRIWKEGRFWLVEVPMLSAMTQGRTRKEAFEMIVDLLETMVNRSDFHATCIPGKGGDLEVGSDNVEALVALILQRRRQASGLSLASAAERLNQASRNAYARYEQGQAVPSLTKLLSLLSAVDPEHDIVLTRSPN